MPKKTEYLDAKDKEIQRLKQDNIALLKSALKQAQINKELESGMEKLMEINNKLKEKLKKR